MTAERAQLFALVGRLFGDAPDAAMLRSLGALRAAPGEIGTAYGALAAAARAATPDSTAREYFDLFIGVGRGEILPYASYYLTGFLHDRPLATLRGDLARLGIAKADGVAEPEDHLAFLCETYAGLLTGAFQAPPEAAEDFFARHLRPWAARCCADIAKAQSAVFYRAVAELGRAAFEIESAAADLPT